jgi:hypothetical protein
VRYPWHPWCGRCVFIDASIERNGRLFFYCHVEETLGKSAVEIPAWMFDSSWEQIRLRDLSDTPAVGCEALKNLKLLLATASSGGHLLKETQRSDGGADAKTAKSTTISAGIVSTANPDADLAHHGSGGEGANDASAVSPASPLLETSKGLDSSGGRQ